MLPTGLRTAAIGVQCPKPKTAFSRVAFLPRELLRRHFEVLPVVRRLRKVIGLLIELPLEGELDGHLTNARIYRGAADYTKRRRAEVCIRVRKLWVIESVEQVGPKLNTS